MDLGGVHESQSADIDLDAAATTLGITPGIRFSPQCLMQARTLLEGSRFRIPGYAWLEER